jgi:hypothetical protein
MIEHAFGIPFGSKDSMTALNFVKSQIDANESVHPYALKQDKLAFPGILLEAKETLYQKEGKLDLGQLFDKLVRVYYNNDTTNTEDKTAIAAFQMAMAAHLQLQPKKFMLKNDNMKKLSPLVIRGRQVQHNKAQEGKALNKILRPSMT